jgi:hypothetical protein
VWLCVARELTDASVAGGAGVVRARDAGAVKPLLLVHSANVAHLNEYSKAVEVSLLSALAGLYEVRIDPVRARLAC